MRPNFKKKEEKKANKREKSQELWIDTKFKDLQVFLP